MTRKIIWKILLFMKRKEGMSVADFRDYYENHHIPLCLPYMTGVARYVRRYLDPQTHAESGSNDELPYDVITEIWFEKEAIYQATLAHLTTAIMPDEIIADELKFLHRPTMRMATVIEEETLFS